MKRWMISAVTLAVTAGAQPACAADWEFSVTPYLWMAGLEADLAPFPALPPVHTDSSFTDVVDILQMAFAASGEARKGRWAVNFDGSYVDTGLSAHTVSTDPNFFAVGLGTKTVTIATDVSYRVVEGPKWTVDLYGGGRLSYVKNDLTLTGPNGQQLGGSHDETWIDPYVGARAKVALAPKWSAAAYADIGGFGIASDFAYQLYAGLGYRIGKSTTLEAGYRYYSDDYEKDGFEDDFVQQGPQIGVRIDF